MDTFSANSLKILDKDSENFRLKYKEGLFLNPDNSNTKAGQNLHNFLCFYLKGFDMTKIEASFSKKDRDFIDKIKEFDAIKTLKAADDGPLSFVVRQIRPKARRRKNFTLQEDLMPFCKQKKGFKFTIGKW